MSDTSNHELTSLIGGRLALDFANAGSPKRSLSWEELISFLEATRVISAARTAVLLELPESDPQAAHALLQRSSHFRDTLRQTFRGMLHKESAKAETVEAINALLRVTEGHDELRFDGGRWRIEFVAGRADWSGCWRRSPGPLRRLWRKARTRGYGSAQIQTADCSSTTRSRTKRRRWCAMAVCGNRHKVASFAKKHAAKGAGK